MFPRLYGQSLTFPLEYVKMQKNATDYSRWRRKPRPARKRACKHLLKGREVKDGDGRNGRGALSWTSACRIGDYLSNVIRDRDSRPPESAGVYVVSERPWDEMPSKSSEILYVGQAKYLRSRIGALLCDLMGFTGDEYSEGEAYEHSGGHFLWHYYCIAHAVEPTNLYLGWCSPCRCLACAEVKLRELINIPWNLYSTRSCEAHIPPLGLFHNCSTSYPPSAASGRHHDSGKN